MGLEKEFGLGCWVMTGRVGEALDGPAWLPVKLPSECEASAIHHVEQNGWSNSVNHGVVEVINHGVVITELTLTTETEMYMTMRYNINVNCHAIAGPKIYF